jgi:hypothetical protein
MAIDPRDAFKNWLEAYVREVTREQLGYTEDELDDAAQFLAISATEPEPPPLSIAVLRTARAQLLGDSYNGRWGDFSYSDYAFLYDVGISLDKEDGGLL